MAIKLRIAILLALASFLATCKDTTDPDGNALQITVAGAGSGQVTMDPVGGASCVNPTATSCSELYTDPEQQVTLTAAASAGSVFAGWSGDCTGTSTCVVTMNQTRNVTATFVVGNLLTLFVTGGGTVNLSPAGETGGGGTCLNPATAGDCTAFYATANQQVSLTAIAQADHVFSGYTGDCNGLSACSVTMSQPRTVNVQFDAGHTLAVNINGNGSVSISPPTQAGGGQTCGNPTTVSCTAFYANSAQQVVLTATAPQNFRFEVWSGPCSSSGSQCVVTMNQNRAADVTFSPTSGGQSLTITINGSGSVSMNPAGNNVPGANCSNPTTSACTAIYTSPNQQVTLTATPSGSGAFQGWSGNHNVCSGTSPCIVTMSQVRNVTATFSP